MTGPSAKSQDEDCIVVINDCIKTSKQKFGDEKTEFVTFGIKVQCSKLLLNELRAGDHIIPASNSVRNLGKLN